MGKKPASSFYMPKEGRGTCRERPWFRHLLPESGESSWQSLLLYTVRHGVGRGHRPGELLARRGMRRRPVALVGGVVTSVGPIVLRV